MAQAQNNRGSWDVMVDKSIAQTRDWTALRKATTESMEKYQGLYSGYTGDQVVGLRQKDYWALLDLLAAASGRIAVAIDIERQLTERLDALEGAAAKAPAGAVYRGVFKSEQGYSAGDLCTHAGSLWHANCATEKRPGDGADWTLAVKRGRAGTIHSRSDADEDR